MIEAINTYATTESLGEAAGTTQTQSVGFSEWIKREALQADALIKEADAGMTRLAKGEAVSLHEVMLSMEEAKLQFQLVTQIRNRVLEAYQEILRMQI